MITKGCVTFDGFMLERGDRSILILATHSVRSMVDGEITEPRAIYWCNGNTLSPVIWCFIYD